MRPLYKFDCYSGHIFPMQPCKMQNGGLPSHWLSDRPVIALLIGLISTAMSGKCPQSQSFNPCVCESQTIRCNGNQSFHLKNVFDKFSQSLAQNEKNFDFLILNSNGFESIESNAFSDITFRFVKIFDAQSLETIDPLAFDGTDKTIEVFEIIGANRLKNTSQLLSAVSLLRNAISITLNVENLRSVPSRAFRQMKNLEELTITNFELNHLSDHFLDFDYQSLDTLTVDLSNNNLSEFSFERYSLSGLKRPIELDLRDNRITVLESHIFRTFLVSDANNLLRLTANPLNCSDCRNQWLVTDKHLFDSNVEGARCPQFISIFELEESDFSHCNSF